MEYKASNGVGVRIDELGDLDYHTNIGWSGLCGGAVVEALREFFQHEHDEELGRWRWPENPDFVVYAEDDGVHNVVNEKTGLSLMATRGGVNRHDDQHADAARAYFETHPERKPWHDAKPGEVWELKVDGIGLALAVDSAGEFQGLVTRSPQSASITDGRRIWPESD